MAFSLVQQINGNWSVATPGPPVSLAVNNNNAAAINAGDTLLLVITLSAQTHGNNVASVSDNVNGPWARLGHNQDTLGNYEMSLWRVKAAATGINGLVVTVTANSFTSGTSIGASQFFNFRGGDGSLNRVGIVNSAISTAAQATVTNDTAGNLEFFAIGNNGGATSAAATGDATNFNDSVHASQTATGAYRLNGIAGTRTGGVTLSVAKHWSAIAATFNVGLVATKGDLVVSDSPVTNLIVWDEGGMTQGSPSQPNLYLVGNVARLHALWSDPFNNDQPVDPSTASFEYTDPTGVVTTIGPYPAGGIIREAAGLYHKDITVNLPGDWYYDGVSTGTASARAEGKLTGIISKVLP